MPQLQQLDPREFIPDVHLKERFDLFVPYTFFKTYKGPVIELLHENFLVAVSNDANKFLFRHPSACELSLVELPKEHHQLKEHIPIWSSYCPAELRMMPGDAPYISFSPNGRYIVCVTDTSLDLQLYDIETEQLWLVSRGLGYVLDLHFAPVLEFSHDSALLAYQEDSAIVVYDIQKKQKFLLISIKPNFVRFSLDNTMLIFGIHTPPSVQWWTLDGKLLHTFYVQHPPRFGVVRPDASLLVADQYAECIVYSLSPLATTTGRLKAHPTPKGVVVVTGPAVHEMRKGYFTVRAICQRALQEAGFPGPNPKRLFSSSPWAFFHFLYRRKNKERVFAKVDEYKLNQIFQPIFALMKELTQEIGEEGLDVMVRLVEKAQQKVKLAGGLGLEEWEEQYQ